MKKILGIAAVLLLCGATASAKATGVGPPSNARDCISICFGDMAIGVQVNGDQAADIGVIFNDTAIFMGATDGGLQEYLHVIHIAATQLEANSGSATGVDLLGAGKIDAAFFMSEDEAQPVSTAVIHSPPPDPNTGFRGITSVG
ncbi:MAG: hypothetical protein HY569_02550 [Candidatus Magasanikbacteria bacterium]|nr:hypothetical protein [Candidatus Magasanikbacteria bacterium]